MHLGEILIGAALLGLGAHQMKKGAERLGKGLRGASGVRVERDSGRKMPKKAMVVKKGGMTLDFREVRVLEDRIAAVRTQIKKGRTDPKVIAWARKQVNKKCGDRWCIPEKNKELEADAIFRGVRSDARYVSDPIGIDLYAHPRRTLELKGEDCDGLTSLGVAATMSIGIPCRLKTVETVNSTGGQDHIYYQAQVAPGRWKSYDPSVDVQPGWEAPRSMVRSHRLFEVNPYV
jgi:hypothetical protein